jgi:hypothetical protein
VCRVGSIDRNIAGLCRTRCAAHHNVSESHNNFPSTFTPLRSTHTGGEHTLNEAAGGSSPKKHRRAKLERGGVDRVAALQKKLASD